MKFTSIAALLLLVALFAVGSNAKSELCLFCSGLFNVPQDWPTAQKVLTLACSKLGNAKTSCENLVRAADFTTSYSKHMYPHIVKMKDLGCKKYC